MCQQVTKQILFEECRYRNSGIHQDVLIANWEYTDDVFEFVYVQCYVYNGEDFIIKVFSRIGETEEYSKSIMEGRRWLTNNQAIRDAVNIMEIKSKILYDHALAASTPQ